MSRSLTILFRRNPLGDWQKGNIDFEGYEILWPDGRPVAIGLDAFCKHGQRLLGLGKYLLNCDEKLVKLVCMPLSGRDDDINRIPGYRVRRFYVQRRGTVGRLHFLDGTPTITAFDILRDDRRVLQLFWLDELREGEILWFDLAAVAIETAMNESEACFMDSPVHQDR
jgi:hypothetical protein